MGEFFKPRRRKVGVCTLLLACVLTMGWVRSIVSIDFIQIPLSGQVIFGFSSADQSIALKFGPDKEDDGERFWISDDLKYWDNHSADYPQFQYPDVRHHYPMFPGEGDCPVWYWEWNGLSIGESPHRYYPVVRHTFVLVPYWSVVIPMVVLSMRLLLTECLKKVQKAQKRPPGPKPKNKPSNGTVSGRTTQSGIGGGAHGWYRFKRPVRRQLSFRFSDN